MLHREEKEYRDKDLSIVLEDMEVNSDFDLHNVCCGHPELAKLKVNWNSI